MMRELYARSLPSSYECQETNCKVGKKALPKTLVCPVVRMYFVHLLKLIQIL